MKAHLSKLINGRRNLTIADQVVVSASNFATGIILVRGLGLKQFGVFTVAFALVLLLISIQLSFICSPMITLSALSDDGTPRRCYLRGMYGVQLWFCSAATVAAAVISAVFLRLRPQPDEMKLLIPFMLSIVFYLMQDWLRRYFFAAGKAQLAVWNDVIRYLGQTIVLLVLMRARMLTVCTTFWTIAAVSVAAVVLGLAGEQIQYDRGDTRDAWNRSRGLSRDLALASQLQWVVYQGAMLIGAAMLGAEAAGSIRATQNVVGPVNVAYQAMENIVPIKAGEEMRRGGIRRVSKFLYRFGAQGLVVLAALFIVIGLFSRQFLEFFYGHEGAVYGAVLDLQLVYFLLFWPLRQLSYLFRTINRTPTLLMASFLAALASILLIYPCVRSFGDIGIMIAAVVGQIVNLLYLAWVWLRIRSSLELAEGAADVAPRLVASKVE